MNRNRRIRRISIIITIFCLTVIFFRFQEKWETKKVLQDASGELKVHFMDTGQSESILIQ